MNWDGRTFDVFETSTWARAAQRLHVTYRYQPRGRGEPRFGSIRHRYLLSGQIAGLCERAALYSPNKLLPGDRQRRSHGQQQARKPGGERPREKMADDCAPDDRI